MKILKITLLFLSASLLSACNSEPVDPAITPCPDVRTPMCTMIYQPVCGVTSDGVQTTYASDCTACGNADVVGYREGSCPDDLDSPG